MSLRPFGIAAALAVGLTLLPAAAGPEEQAHRSAIADWVAARHGAIVGELSAFVALPNDSSDAEQLRANADHLTRMLEQRGLTVRRFDVEGLPYVFARLEPGAPRSEGTTPVVLFYCHFDGQPVDPARWSVSAPYEPKLVGEIDDPEARLYGRSSSDDKGPIVALLNAIDALRAAGIPPNIDAKFIFDPEEEIGSPHIATLVERHGELLEADLMVFADGPRHQSGRPTLAFGARGIVTVTLTAYGPTAALHSGHYGNWAPNPAEKLANLLASMKDADGRVLVKGFYDDVVPLTEIEREALAGVPAVEAGLQHDLAIVRPDGGGASLQELINLPSLNVRGMASGWVGEQARTIVPSTATAELDLRLVTDIAPRRQVERIKSHVATHGFFMVDREPDERVLRARPNVVWVRSGHGTPAVRTPMDTPLSRALIAAVRRASTVEPVLMPTLGGTVPLYRFSSVLGMPVYVVPIVNHDNNQHAPDENLRLGNLWEGIVVYASLMRLGEED